ncbi:MAG: TIGR00366 family protein [Gammaproteobacteria bacterium]|nr:TIGR00366 family protein [Gammaproteobacteria bacterium]
MLRTVGSILSTRLQRWIPEPFVFAIVLTLLVALMALAFTDTGFNKVIDDWYRGFWILLDFGMQMVLILATGYAIALSPPISRLIDRLASMARTPGSVYVLIVIVGGLFALVSWSWAVLTAVLARELARRVEGLDYSYLVACVYLSSQPWVGGLSSSIPLLLNTDGNFLIETGVLSAKVPIVATLGSLLNWLYLALYFLTLPLFMWLMRPHAKSALSITDMADPAYEEKGTVAEEAAAHTLTGDTVSDRLNNGVWLQLLIALAALSFIVRHFANNGFDLDLNIMIFLFIAIGLITHRTPMRYVIAMKRACGNVSGIVFQYPFYAGIMGIMMFSGLGSLIADGMADGATVHTLPFLALLSGALINFAIPSAGGEWAVIGPALTEAAINVAGALPAEQVELFIARIAMAVAYGETSTNLLQPFFLLIILPVMGAGVRIQARDVMGYLVIPFFYVLLTSALLVTFTPL